MILYICDVLFFDQQINFEMFYVYMLVYFLEFYLAVNYFDFNLSFGNLLNLLNLSFTFNHYLWVNLVPIIFTAFWCLPMVPDNT